MKLPAFPRYPLAAHKTQQARISILNPDDGTRKAYYLGAFGTPESHALYSILQLWYNTHEGQVLDRGIAQLEAAAILNSNNFSPGGCTKSDNGFATEPEPPEPHSIVLPVVISSALAIAALVAVFSAGVYVGRPSKSAWDGDVELSKPVIGNMETTEQPVPNGMDPRVYSFIRHMEIGLEWRDEQIETDPEEFNQEAMERYGQLKEMRNQISATNTYTNEQIQSGSLYQDVAWNGH